MQKNNSKNTANGYQLFEKAGPSRSRSAYVNTWDWDAIDKEEEDKTATLNTDNRPSNAMNYFANKVIARFLEDCGFSSEEDIVFNLGILEYFKEDCIKAKHNFLENAAIIAQDTDLQALYKRLGFEPTIEVKSNLLKGLQKIKEDILAHLPAKSGTKNSLSQHQKILKANVNPKTLITNIVEIGSDSINLQTYEDVLYLMAATSNIVRSTEDYGKSDPAKYPVRYLCHAMKQEYQLIRSLEEPSDTNAQSKSANQTASNTNQQKLPLRTANSKLPTTKTSRLKENVKQAQKEPKETVIVSDKKLASTPKQPMPLANLFSGQSIISHPTTERKSSSDKQATHQSREEKKRATPSHKKPTESSRNTSLLAGLFSGQSTVKSSRKSTPHRYTTTIEFSESEDEGFKSRNAH